MSGPTIRIGETTVIPDVSISADLGTVVDITNINDFDLGFLGNKQKISSTPPRTQSPGIVDVSKSSIGDGIEFVNLEDTNVKVDIKPAPINLNSSDSIHIVRDNGTPKVNIDVPFSLKSSSNSAFNPIQPAPATVPVSKIESVPVATNDATESKSWFSKLTGSSTTTTAAPAKSWFGGSANAEPAALPDTTAKMTPEQEAIKKAEGLTMLERMDRKGISGTKMTMMNTYEEIQAELSRRKDSKGLEASIRFQRSMLTTVTSGMEFLNNRYDPFGVNLEGWSEQINENQEDYDEIFEELYDKYKDRSKVAPEVRLIMSLGLSAAMCHVTNTMFKSRMPGMDDILRKNPELAKQMARAAAEQAVGPGFANFVSMGMNGKPPQQQQQQQQQPQQQPQFNPLSMMSDMFMGGSAPGPFMPNMQSEFVNPGQAERSQPVSDIPTARREMRGPTGVEDIIEKLHNGGEEHSHRVLPPIDKDDAASLASGMTTETMRRAGKSYRARRVTMQPEGSTLTLNV